MTDLDDIQSVWHEIFMIVRAISYRHKLATGQMPPSVTLTARPEITRHITGVPGSFVVAGISVLPVTDPDLPEIPQSNGSLKSHIYITCNCQECRDERGKLRTEGAE